MSIMFISWCFVGFISLPQFQVLVNAQGTYSRGVYSDVVKIGGLFDGNDATEEAAFKHAVERFNSESAALRRFAFNAQFERVLPENSYDASAKVCSMLKGGVAAVFGPQTHESASHVQSICDAYEMPHVETKWDYRIRKENYLINLHPHPSTLSRAINDLVEAFAWDKYVIIYEDEDSLFKLQDLIKGSVPPRRNAILKLLPPSQDCRGIFREILRASDIRKILIDCDARKLENILKQAQQIGIMTYKFSFIITSLDLHTVDLNHFKYSEANITSFRMVDPEKPETQSLLREWASLTLNSDLATVSHGRGNYFVGDQSGGSSRRNVYIPGFSMEYETSHAIMIRTDIALIYDAVQLLGKALHILNQTIDVKSLDCDSSDTWQHGYSIINYMKMVQMQGLTGLVHFNTSGFRTDVSFDVIQLKEQGLTKIGAWDSKFVAKFNWTKLDVSEAEQDESAMDLRNRTLVVTTFMTDPMTMWTRSDAPLQGNARYEGFAVDLLHRLSLMLGFKYIVKPVNDGKYGKLDKEKGEWDGMIREIMDGVADIVVADLTVNKERQEAVDFTMPFMNLGISILYVVPSAKPPSLFSFMLPFSLDVWYYMAFSFFGVSVILFILARVTPYEWDNPHPCIEDPDELHNQFTFLNSFWFTIGSIMQQGSDIAPKAVSTRMIAGIWWFFTLIMVSSYTANLATFLIVQDLDVSIRSLEDLPKQTKAKYGCVDTGTTAAFFRNSPFPTHQEIWRKMVEMNKKHKVFMKKNSEGLKRVAEGEGNYAFFMESTAIEYNVERNCKLSQVGGPLDSKGYAVALKKGSKYRQAFSSGILRLQEQGVLDELKRKWWKEQRKENQCPAGGDSDSVKPLRLANVGGVFVVLIGGCIIAAVFAFTEFFWQSRQLAADDGVSVMEEMMKELKFALACRGGTKQVYKKSSSVSDNDNGTER
ncbi:unnamed protein product [Allacma fusca]|uniref:Glutamate receptor ionotropic, kainate 2-like n=1 Tax=Allacma fusca TaxID=39272 RepID=A0A8J2L2B4_9HEXA|nr:unnamed protein product [Allacma fusca]